MPNAAHRTFIDFPVRIKEVKRTSASELGEHDPDVINILFDLVYVGTNKNGDMFVESELRASYQTLVGKPIDWEHYEPNIGYITQAEFIEEQGNVPAHVTCEGTLWAWRYPEYTDLVISSAKLGELGLGENADYGMSMEAYFEDADYIIGDFEQVIPMSEDTGELEFLRGRTIGDKYVARLLKKIVFGGCGVTETPAERQARLKAAASNRSLSDRSELFPGLADSEFALPALRMFPIDRRDRLEASLSYFETAAKTLGENEDREAQVQEARIRLKKAAESAGLDASKYLVGLSSVREESEVAMDDHTTVIDEVVSEETEAHEAEDTAVETPTEESLEDQVVEAEVESDEGTATVEFDFRAAFEELKSLLSPPVPAESEASEDLEDSEEKDELTVANERVAKLESALEAEKAAHLGYKRFVELTSAGVEVKTEVQAKKQEFLAGLSEAAWSEYFSDITSVRPSTEASVTVEGEDEDEGISNLHLTDASVETDPLETYRSVLRGTPYTRDSVVKEG